MGLEERRVLRGTRSDFADHLSARTQQEYGAADPTAKGTAKDKHGHECAAKALEWALEEFGAWEEIPEAGGAAPPPDPAASSNGSEGATEADRRAAAAGAAD